MIDISPAAERMAGLLASVDDSQFGRATPCPAASVGDLIDHVCVLTSRFALAARKDVSPSDPPPPQPNAANLAADWRRRIPTDLDAMGAAWRQPDAWEGTTRAGGLELPGQVAGLIALDELIVHGWDLAVALGEPYAPGEDEVVAAMSFVEGFNAPRDGRLFGPIVAVAESAPALDRLLGLTGRHAGWRPS